MLHLKVSGVIRKRVPIEPEAEAEGPDYEEVEKDPLFRLTYFNTNRIHCLRAKYIHGDKNAPEFYADNEALIKHPPKAS